MAANPKHIRGIYNYCDRWCERCSFTSRCAVYTSEQQNTPEENDITNKAFWDKMANNITIACTLLQKNAEENGFVFRVEDEESMKAFSENKDRKREEMQQHPLIQYSKNYMMQANAFLQNNQAFKNSGETLIQLVELGIKDIAETKREIIVLNDYVEIVQWYLFQIQVKFMRALPLFDDEEDDAPNSDTNGSAKVALIAVDRCIMAWQHIMQLLPEAEDDVLPLLALLQKIRNLGEQTFPNARAFVRPGFDE